MQRVAFIINLKPGYEEEYKRRHDEIWPEMLQALRNAGMNNYSIFLGPGNQLFAYLETDDFERMARTIGQDPVNARWQEHMKDLISVDIDPQTGFARLLPEMFHTE
ncbi:MAG: L-rhamnose mutarotase [Chloroflexota bacterium]|nr:L-rhamnose mutarotase [Chloroflexota bacterium]